jgi:hypothetical protein
MSRLTDLIAQVAKSNPALADDLRREVGVLSARRPFGLNFERHLPESVHLPERRVRRGDKVVFRAPRGESDRGLNKRLWVATGFEDRGARRKATLMIPGRQDDLETTTRLVSDLVVAAEFRDPIYPGLRSTGKVERGGDKPFHTVSGLDAVPKRHPAVRLTGTPLGGGLRVAIDHLARPPAGQTHQVALVAAGRQPGVGKGVAELMWVQARESGRSATSRDHLEQPRRRHGPSPAKPEVGQVCEWVAGPHAQIAVQGKGGLAAERDCSRPAALAEHDDDLVV